MGLITGMCQQNMMHQDWLSVKKVFLQSYPIFHENLDRSYTFTPINLIN